MLFDLDPQVHQVIDVAVGWKSQFSGVVYSTPEYTTEFNLNTLYMQKGGTRWCSWLRHYATSRKIKGSNPNEVT
jgi:hypothetical protein